MDCVQLLHNNKGEQLFIIIFFFFFYDSNTYSWLSYKSTDPLKKKRKKKKNPNHFVQIICDPLQQKVPYDPCYKLLVSYIQS